MIQQSVGRWTNIARTIFASLGHAVVVLLTATHVSWEEYSPGSLRKPKVVHFP